MDSITRAKIQCRIYDSHTADVEERLFWPIVVAGDTAVLYSDETHLG